jgi:hypothetical protein
MDFKESPFMYAMAAFIILFVVVESVFFMVKASKRAKELGISKETIKDTIISAALFTIAPAISILATVLVLASALGIVLPWIRLSVIGNLAYETVAASTMLEQFGSNINIEVTDPTQFAAVMWVMTVGTSFALFLVPIFCKLIQKKIGGLVSKSEKNSKLADNVSAAAFIGIIAAFIAVSINGKSSDGTSDAGFMSIATLVSAMVIMIALEAVCHKFNLKKLEMFALPISIFAAMGVCILLTVALPESVTSFTWWGGASA